MAVKTADKAVDQPAKPSKFAELRTRYEWLDHLVRAGASYTENHGDHYAGAITYFSILALVPLLMVGFAVAAFVLRANPSAIQMIQTKISGGAPPGMGGTLNKVVDQAINSAGTVGTFGLLTALYSGLGWMTNLREALSEQWGQRDEQPAFLKRLGVDLLALIGLGVALLLSVAVGAAGGLAGPIVTFLGLGDLTWLQPLIRLATVVVGLLASALVFLWVIARLPREPVTWRSAAKAALIGAIGFEIIKQVMIVYIGKVTDSPTGALFGPVLGLMVFTFTVSRFILFLTAYAATAQENEVIAPPPPPPPAVIRPEVTVRGGPDVGTTAGLVGAGAVAGLLGGRLLGGRLLSKRR